MDLQRFGYRLVSERERLGFKAIDVYSRLNIHRNSQSQYERGLKEPGISYLAGLLTLGFDVVWLLNDDDQTRPVDVLKDDERTLLCAYRALSAHGRYLVGEVAQQLKGAVEPSSDGS